MDWEEINTEDDPEEIFNQMIEIFLPRWGIITQDPLDKADVRGQFDDLEETDPEDIDVDLDEDDLENIEMEEAVAEFMYGFSKLAEEEVEKEDINQVFLWLLGRMISEFFNEVPEDDIHSLVPVVAALEDLSHDERELAKRYTLQNFQTDRRVTVAQNMQHLETEMLEGDLEIKITNPDSAQEAVNVYKRSMDVCDGTSPFVLGIKRICDGETPFEVDLESMPFGAICNELEESQFSPLVRGINRDIRNGISHGDLQINPIDDTITVPSQDMTFEYDEFASLVREAVLSAKFMYSLQMLVMYQILNSEIDQQD